jgi:hypothetical protein
MTHPHHQEWIPSRLPQQTLGMLVPLLIPLLSLHSVQLHRLRAEALRGIANVEASSSSRLVNQEVIARRP